MIFAHTGSHSSFRVLQIVNTLNRSDGGPARNAYELHRAINRREDCVAVVVVVHPSAWSDTVASEGGKQKSDVIGGQLHRSISLLRSLRLMYQADAVIIHGYYLPWTPVAALLAKICATPAYLTPHGSLTAYQRRYSVRKKWIFDQSAGRILQAGIKAFVVGSEPEAADLKAFAPHKPSAVVGVGASLGRINRFTPREGDGTSTVLLSISRIAPKKRHDLMIDALARLRKSGIDARLDIAGSGPEVLVSSLKEHARASGVSDFVRFIGEVSGERKTQLYARSDVFLAPSDDENFGIAVAESLSHGLACVASSHVASATGLTIPAGIVVRDRSGAGIADAVQQLLARTSHERFAASRDFAAARFSWTAVAARWLAVMKSMKS